MSEASGVMSAGGQNLVTGPSRSWAVASQTVRPAGTQLLEVVINSAAVEYSVVPGGYRNVAAGSRVAAGWRAKASHTRVRLGWIASDTDVASTGGHSIHRPSQRRIMVRQQQFTVNARAV